jgi:hypothetical protein
MATSGEFLVAAVNIQGTVKTSAWIVAIAAELVLAVGGSWDNDRLRLRPQGHDANDRPTNVKGALTPTLTTEKRPASHERHPMSEISAPAVVGPAPSSRAEQRDPQRPLKPRTRSRGASPPADPATNPALVYLMCRLT